MKKSIYLLLLVLPLLFGCQDIDLILGNGAGTEVKFTANTYYQNGLKTKTEYSGYDENNQLLTSTSQYERIDWVDNDLLSIYMTDGDASNQLDYKVASHATHQTIYQNSVANVTSNVSDSRLLWLSNNTHTFYSLYPSPATTGVDATKVSLSGNVITASIPATQVVTAAASGSSVYKPDMNYAYMWAATTAEAGSTVSLDFKPLMTAFEITLGTAIANGPKLTGFSLTTDTNSPYLSGDFTATIGADLTSYTVSNITNGSRAISVAFDNYALTPETPITFTVFALPQELKHLCLKFMFSDNSSKELELKRKASDSGEYEYMTFAGGKKYRITNLSIVDGWIYTLQEVDAGSALIRNLASAGDNTNTKGIYSYRTKANDDTVVEEVAMKFRYSPADDTGANLEQWSDNLPEWLTALLANPHTSEQNPDDAFTLTSTYTEIPVETEVTIDQEPIHTKALKDNGTTGSESAPKDLALYDITSLGTKRAAGVKTANSYVVDRAGWYMFPLVYGNAIDCEMGNANGWNVNSYSAANLVAAGFTTLDGSVLPTLKNYLNAAITSPYILDDTGLAAGDVEAVIVWEDVAEGKEFIASAAIETAPDTDASYKTADGSAKTVPYIKFEVDADKICQGNAVIALRRASDQTIIWSWHIWVTDTQLQTLTVPTRSTIVTSNDLLTTPLGMRDDRHETHYFFIPRLYYVEATQVDADGQPVGNQAPVVFPVTQEGRPYYITSHSTAPFYQYGRKDPFLPFTMELYSNKPNDIVGIYGPSYSSYNLAAPANRDYSSPAGYTVTANDSRLVTASNPTASSVSLGIQTPYAMITNGTWDNSPSGSPTRNLWNMVENNSTTIVGNEEANFYNDLDRMVYKTIYDPCPPGFSVPGYSAFTILTVDGKNHSMYSYASWMYVDNDQSYASYVKKFYANDEHTAIISIPPSNARYSGGSIFPFMSGWGDRVMDYVFYHTTRSSGTIYCRLFSMNDYWSIDGPTCLVAKNHGFGVLPAKEIKGPDVVSASGQSTGQGVTNITFDGSTVNSTWE